jgi:acetylornithine deacetylase/succinyl-diaminopimelate desuccinylase-like protein
MINQVLERLQENQADSLERLVELLRVPSISTDSAYAGDCAQAAQWICEQLTGFGLHTSIEPTASHPAVVAKTPEPIEGAPHVLFYGHYDVQPPDPLDQWTTPPFEPTIRDGRIYARGACDDKGQVMCFIEALRAWHEVTGGIPINLTVLIEGDEEGGSTAMEQFVPQNADRLKADIALVSDTAMWDANTPSIIYALRGLLYMEVKLFGPSRDLHSGVYGGTVPNPANELTAVLGQLFDESHAVTLEGFYDDVQPLSDEERQQWNDLPFDEEQYAKAIGLNRLHGEQPYGTLERRWARPSCDINGIYGGYSGAGAKTVIPSMAGAKISFRLVADQNPRKIAESFQQWFEKRTPPGCRWEFIYHGDASPVLLPADSPWITAAVQALRLGTGHEPVLVREGATIPIISTFKTELGLDSLLVGFGLNDDNLHAPNEKFDLRCFEMGCRTHAVLLEMLASRRL